MVSILICVTLVCFARHSAAIPTSRLLKLEGFKDSSTERRPFTEDDFKGTYSRFLELSKNGHLCPKSLELLSNGKVMVDGSVKIPHIDTVLNKKQCNSEGSLTFHAGQELATETIENVFTLSMEAKGIESILRHILMDVRDFYYAVEENHISCGGASLFSGTVIMFTSDSNVFGEELRIPWEGHPRIAFMRDAQKSCAYNGTRTPAMAESTSAPTTSTTTTSAPSTSTTTTSAPSTSIATTPTSATSAVSTSAPTTSTATTSAPSTSTATTSAPTTSTATTSAPSTSTATTPTSATSPVSTSVPTTSTTTTLAPATSAASTSTTTSTNSASSTATTSAPTTSEGDEPENGTSGTDVQPRGTIDKVGVKATVTPSPIRPRQPADQGTSEDTSSPTVGSSVTASAESANSSPEPVDVENLTPLPTSIPVDLSGIPVDLTGSVTPSGSPRGMEVPQPRVTPDVPEETLSPTSIPVDLTGSVTPSGSPRGTEVPQPRVTPDVPEETLSPTRTPSDSEISTPESDSSPEPASPTPSRGITPSPTSDNGSTCFPSHAQAKLGTGKTIRMDSLQIGDVVQVGNGVASPIVGFSHSDRHALSRFIRFTTDSGKVIAVTPTHFMYTSRGLITGGEISTADFLRLEDGTSTKVLKTENILAKGLFNPHTAQGDIVVDGFIASTYTSAVKPGVAHALLVPVRVLERLGAHSSIVSYLSSKPWVIFNARRVFSVHQLS